MDVAGCAVGAATRAEWVDHLAARIAAGRTGAPGHHVSLNAAKWVAMSRDPDLRAAVGAASSVAADGIGVVGAARWLGAPVPERVPGCDLAQDLLRRAATAGWRVYLLGAAPEVVDAVRGRLVTDGVRVVGARDGYFAPDAEAAVAEAIRDARPDLLLVAMGSPRSERFVARWGAVADVPLAMGVGGTFDVLAGRARRVPGPIGAVGLEWAWRWVGSPRARFGRAIVDSARFVAAIAAGRRLR